MPIQLFSRVGPVGFAVATLALGMLPVPLALALVPAEGLARTAPGLSLPSWLFGLVWTVVYPALGVATQRVWVRRAAPGGREALALFAVVYLYLLAFLPITAAAHLQLVTSLMDALGLCFGYVLAWVFWRVDRATVAWMAPLLVWLPTTAALKFATL